jgi:gluconate 5-dehydrogenase
VKNMQLFDLSGKIALVTGSSRGLGLALAEALAGAGATIVLNARDPRRLEQAADALTAKGTKAFGYAFDVAAAADVARSVSAIESGVGPIDILVNNAGIQLRSPLEECPEDVWQRVLSTNLTGAFLVSQCVARRMIERRAGKIINICSVMSELARPTVTPYTAAKGGLKMLTRGMATEWGKYNIQVNGLGPGYFVTDMTKPLVEDEKFNSWLCARTPANRWGQPHELAGAAIFLASKASDYVNGHILYVDGGLLSSI